MITSYCLRFCVSSLLINLPCYVTLSLYAFPSPVVFTRLIGPSLLFFLHFEEFSRELANHPNQQQVSYVLRGIQFGFRLGFHPSQKLKPAKKNKPSAVLHAPVIDDYLANEVLLGRVAGPFSSPPLPNLHISSFGVIPKKGQPGKWRLIVDLSAPGGASVNDGIDPQDFTLQYIKLDSVIRMVARLSQSSTLKQLTAILPSIPTIGFS